MPLEEKDAADVETGQVSAQVTGVCAQTRVPIGPVFTGGEIAGARVDNGMYLAWTSGPAGQPASIVQVDGQLRVLRRWDLGLAGPNLNGVANLGNQVQAAYGNNAFAFVDMWQFTPDLGIANYFATYAGNAARMPFLSNPAGTKRAYLWSANELLIASAMDSEIGLAGGGSQFVRPAPIPALAGDNGVHDTVQDSAIVFLEDLGGGSMRCSAANIGFDDPSAPSLRATRVVSTDCRRARIAAGPTDDIQVVVTQSAAGVLRAHLRRAGGDVVRVLSSSGRAAKVRFDGTRFWIVWRDTGVANLRIAHLDLIGTLVVSPTPGPAVAGDEAFDLVRTSTTTVVIAALAPNALDFVTLCR